VLHYSITVHNVKSFYTMPQCWSIVYDWLPLDKCNFLTLTTTWSQGKNVSILCCCQGVLSTIFFSSLERSCLSTPELNPATHCQPPTGEESKSCVMIKTKCHSRLISIYNIFHFLTAHHCLCLIDFLMEDIKLKLKPMAKWLMQLTLCTDEVRCAIRCDRRKK
jgi:hypothetical protein